MWVVCNTNKIFFCGRQSFVKNGRNGHEVYYVHSGGNDLIKNTILYFFVVGSGFDKSVYSSRF